MKPPVLAAYEVATSHGITPDRCDILQDAHTTVVRLTESLVARVVCDDQGPRHGTAWFNTETAIAAHLSHHNAPIIPLHPGLPPVAHHKDGFTMNFWRYVEITAVFPEPSDVGKTLHACHHVLRSFPVELPHLAILHETISILKSNSNNYFDTTTSSLLEHHIHHSIDQLSPLPHQPLHGDAHTGNIVMTSKGPLWTDWEDAFSGPVEWDIASVIWNSKLLDDTPAITNAILSAYESCGYLIDQSALHHSLIARAAVMSAWYPILYPNPSPQRQSKLKHRLDWLAALPL